MHLQNFLSAAFFNVLNTFILIKLFTETSSLKT